MMSPSTRVVVWMRRPLTKVPLVLPRSVIRMSGPCRTMAAWDLETCAEQITRSAVASRPRRKGKRSIGTRWSGPPGWGKCSRNGRSAIPSAFMNSSLVPCPLSLVLCKGQGTRDKGQMKSSHHGEVVLDGNVQVLRGHAHGQVVVGAVTVDLEEQIAGVGTPERPRAASVVALEQGLDRLPIVGAAELLGRQAEQLVELLLVGVGDVELEGDAPQEGLVHQGRRVEVGREQD